MRKRFSDIKNLKLFTAGDSSLRPVGEVIDLLIEDGTWNVRYLVVSTDVPLCRHVLISPAAIRTLDFKSKSIATMLTTQQVVDSPSTDSDRPISRQYEQALVDYYGWPIYWLGRAVLKPQTLEAAASGDFADSVDETKESNLRSASEICGYQIQSHQGPVGVMNDLVVQVNSWMVDHATAESTTWLSNESSMFSTSRIQQVNWSNRNVKVDLSEPSIEPAAKKRSVPAITGETYSSQPLRII